MCGCFASMSYRYRSHRGYSPQLIHTDRVQGKQYYRLPKMVSPAMPYFIKPELNNGDFFNAADRVWGSLHKKPCVKKYGKQTSMSLVKLIWCTGATSNPSRGIGHHSVLETNHLNNWLVPFGFLPRSAMDLPYSKRHATDSSVR